MSIKSYERSSSIAPWPLYNLGDGATPVADTPLKPGDWVAYVGKILTGRGIVISVNTTICVVLWSDEPSIDLSLPIGKRVFPSLVASSLVSIQPMTAPVGKIFFLDYKYDASHDITHHSTEADNDANK